jgi:hypothetical protein
MNKCCGEELVECRFRKLIWIPQGFQQLRHHILDFGITYDLVVSNGIKGSTSPNLSKLEFAAARTCG